MSLLGTSRTIGSRLRDSVCYLPHSVIAPTSATSLATCWNAGSCPIQAVHKAGRLAGSCCRRRQRKPHMLQAVQGQKGSAAPTPPAGNSNAEPFAAEILGPGWTNRARLSDELLNTLIELPGTKGITDLRSRANDLATWKMALQRGTLPRADDIEWPSEPFKTKFTEALRNLEMPRFTRRYPAILNTLMRQMLAMVQDFEKKMAEMEAEQKPPPQQQQQQQTQQQSRAAGQEQEQQQGDGQEGSGEGQAAQQEMEEMLQEAAEQASQAGQGGGKGQQMQMKLEEMKGGAAQQDEMSEEAKAQMEAQLADAADEIVDKFESQMGSVMENLTRGEMAFDDLNALLEGQEGFDLSRGTWRRSGWKEVEQLRKVLEDCPELRELVRRLGRGGGKGPLRRAPEEVEASKSPPGVIRSPLQPEEVRGLSRSGDLSRMLPSEMAMLAHGWPRKARSDIGSAGSAVSSSSSSVGGGSLGSSNGRSSGHATQAVMEAARDDLSRPTNGRSRQQSSGGGSNRSSGSSTGTGGFGIGSNAAINGRSNGGNSTNSSVSGSSKDDSSSQSNGSKGSASEDDVDGTTSGEFDEVYFLPGAHAARMLHRVRRAEGMLMSYERTGWLEHDSARVTGRMEIRPAAEMGPIILCLDTSGSMNGARETVAKALALECMRGAHRQNRACYLYAFSGPSDVQELDLGTKVESLDRLLEFLAGSFMGGTDVDRPLELSLARLEEKNEWSQADILMVTDGEIPDPSDSIVQRIKTAHEEYGLEVHGLLVANHISDPMKKLCTDLHVFKSWTAVGGRDYR